MSKKKTYKNFKGGLKTITEYSDFIPPISDSAFALLKENIKSEGVIRDPLVIDEDFIILDGHSRYKIAEMLDMAFEVRVKKVDSIEEGQLWIVDNQMGRKHLSKKELIKLEEMVEGVTGKKEEFTNETRITVSWVSKEDILKMFAKGTDKYKQAEALVNDMSYDDLEEFAAELSSYTHPAFQDRLVILIEDKLA